MGNHMRFIDANMLINSVETNTDISGFMQTYIRGMIREQPTIDAEPVRHGKWEIETIREYELSYGSIGYEPVYKCSNCKISTESYLRTEKPIMPEDADFPNYCPYCGARMKEE